MRVKKKIPDDQLVGIMTREDRKQFSSDFIKEFSERLSNEITLSLYTKTQIAQLIGVKKACISDYCKGRIFPSVPVLCKLCQVLDVSADYLLGIGNY